MDDTASKAQARLLRDLESDRRRIERHGGIALIGAIASCARAGVQAPEWLVLAFDRRFFSVLKGRTSSWDEAFGVPFPKGGVSPLKRRRAERLGPGISAAVRKAILDNPDALIDKDFWSQVAEVAGGGATVAEEVYRERDFSGRSGVQRLRLELAITAAAGAELAELTPIPFSEDVLVRISARAGVPIDDIRQWHDAQVAWALRSGGGMSFDPVEARKLRAASTGNLSKRTGVRLKPRSR